MDQPTIVCRVLGALGARWSPFILTGPMRNRLYQSLPPLLPVTIDDAGSLYADANDKKIRVANPFPTPRPENHGGRKE